MRLPSFITLFSCRIWDYFLIGPNMFASCASMHLFRLSGEPKISGFERCARVVCFVISHPRHQFLTNDPVCAGELPFVPKYNSGVGSACLLTCATAETRRQGVATRRVIMYNPCVSSAVNVKQDYSCREHSAYTRPLALESRTFFWAVRYASQNAITRCRRH